MKINTIIKLSQKLPPHISILMRGPTGIGKSEVAETIAEILKLPYIDVRGSTMEEAQVSGLPDFELSKEIGAATYVLPSWYVKACKEPCVVMLDELNRSLPGVQNGFFQVVLDRELGNDANGLPMQLHPETRVFAAVNVGSEYDVNDMEPALLRRFWVVDVEADVNGWIDYAEKREDISKVLIEFIRTNREHFRVCPASVSPGTVVPTPASWVRLDESFRYAGWIVDDIAGSPLPSLAYQMAMGFVGTEAAIAYTEFVSRYKNIITPEDILNGKATKKKLKALKTPDALHLVKKLIDNGKDNNWSDAQAKNYVEFIKSRGGEFVVSAFHALNEMQNVSNTYKINKLIGADVANLVRETRELEGKLKK